MTDFGDIWRLPGPGGYVREAASLADRGQHVLAIVPRYIADDAEYSNALCVAIGAELYESKRVFPSSDQGGLAASLGFEAAYDFDRFPTTVAELIVHEDVVGRTFICNAADLAPDHAAELPEFLRRLDDESRSVGASSRGRFVFVVSHTSASRIGGSVATVPLWYWDRVARWDVAALLARSMPAQGGVLAEARLETVIELARWDFMLASEMAQAWTRDESELVEYLSTTTTDFQPSSEIRRTGAPQPPESALGAWDAGLVDSWHGMPGCKPAALPSGQGGHERLIWSAQARVFLPWIEVRRNRIEGIVRDKLGHERMGSAIADFSTRYKGVEEDAPTVEIAVLARIISARFGSTEPRLRKTAFALKEVRNRLAHLTPLSQGELEQVVADCAWLDH